jgi:hypothetical protein
MVPALLTAPSRVLGFDGEAIMDLRRRLIAGGVPIEAPGSGSKTHGQDVPA